MLYKNLYLNEFLDKLCVASEELACPPFNKADTGTYVKVYTGGKSLFLPVCSVEIDDEGDLVIGVNAGGINIDN